jgi:hypothetical protein
MFKKRETNCINRGICKQAPTSKKFQVFTMTETTPPRNSQEPQRFAQQNKSENKTQNILKRGEQCEEEH